MILLDGDKHGDKHGPPTATETELDADHGGPVPHTSVLTLYF